MKKKYSLHLLLASTIVCSPSIGIAQNNVFFNKGILQVNSKTILSSYSDFSNQTQGQLVNDGLAYYFGNFTNDGAFTYTKTLDTGEVRFVSTKEQHTIIAGNKVVDLHKVTFDLNTAFWFDLKANLDIWGEANFKEGVIIVDAVVNTVTNQPAGLMSFMPNAKYKNSSASSFVDGAVEKVGAEPFIFPVGNKQHYRPASISAPKNNKDVVLCNYVYHDPAFFEIHQTHVPEIKQINTREYWKVETAKKNQTSFMLTLSWDEHTLLPDLLQNTEQNLHIVHWNSTVKQWEDLGGVVDRENKTITTPANISNFGYFTLARMVDNGPEDDELVIYNYVNATGRDNNDYFIIKNIDKYPNNKVQLFNRWGTKIYETKNYNSEGNVFRGTQKGGGKLSAGTYYYLITYEKKTKNTSYTVKKTGYLHLDAK